MSPLYRETLNEYMASYDEQTAKIERFDKRIEEIAEQERYLEKVKRLVCLLGIKTNTALSLVVETGDFARFVKGNTRLRSQFYKFIRHGKPKNVAVAAVARELACFV